MSTTNPALFTLCYLIDLTLYNFCPIPVKCILYAVWWGGKEGLSLPGISVVLLMSLAALWLTGHQVVKRRFAALNCELTDIYQSALTAPPSPDAPPQLVPLCVDLMRKEHCAIPFEALGAHEKRMVLHAHAVEVLPIWMSRYAALWLSPPNRRLVRQLHDVKSSRPDQPKQYFGAIRHQQQLRSTPKD